MTYRLAEALQVAPMFRVSIGGALGWSKHNFWRLFLFAFLIHEESRTFYATPRTTNKGGWLYAYIFPLGTRLARSLMHFRSV